MSALNTSDGGNPSRYFLRSHAAAKRSNFSESAPAKRLKLEPKPAIFQILSSSQKCQCGKCSKEDLSGKQIPHFHHSSRTSNYWAIEFDYFRFCKLSWNERLIYMVEKNRIIIFDHILNTHVILHETKELIKELIVHFIVLNATTILTLGKNLETNEHQLHLISLLFDDRRFERRLLYVWRSGQLSAVVFTSIIGESSVQSAVLNFKHPRSRIYIGRLDIERKKFTLESTFKLPYICGLCYTLSVDGPMLRVIEHCKTNTLYIYNMKSRTWTKEKLGPVELDDYTTKFDYVWSKKSLYLWKPSNDQEKWIGRRLDLATKNWTKLSFELITRWIHVLSVTENAKGEDEELVAITSHPYLICDAEVDSYDYNTIQHFLFRTPDPLLRLCWLALQEHFLEYRGVNMFDLLRKKTPLNRIFPKLFESMEPIARLHV